MKWKRSDVYVTVGLVGVVALVGVGLWATVPSLRLRGQEVVLRVAALDRLEAGAQVLIAGYPVGRVRAIDPLAVPSGLEFRVVLSVSGVGDDEPPVLRDGTWAEITAESLFGGPVVVLHPSPDPAAAPLQAGAVIPASSGMGGINAAFQRVPAILDRVDSVLSALPELVAQMELTFADAQLAADTIQVLVSEARVTAREARAGLDRLTTRAEDALAGVDATTARAGAGVDTLLAGAFETVDSASAAIQDAARVVRDLGTIADEGRPALSQTPLDLEEAAFVLNHLVKSVSARPYRLLTGVGVPQFPQPLRALPDSGG